MPCDVVLVRHATPAWPRPGGPGDYARALTHEGESQAATLVDDLTVLNPTAVVSSPYLRAVQTVEPLARTIGLAVRTEHELREWDSGIGPTPEYAKYHAESWARPGFARPGGESLRQLSNRATAALASLARKHPGGTVVVGSHGTFIARALAGFGLIEARYASVQAMPMPAVYLLRFIGADVVAMGEFG